MLLRAWNLLGVHVLSSRDANPESVMMTAGDLTIGRTTWRDLLKIKVQCFNCQKQGPVCALPLCAAACVAKHLPHPRHPAGRYRVLVYATAG